MAKKTLTKRMPRTSAVPTPIYGPPLNKRLVVRDGEKHSFSFTSYEAIPSVDVILEVLDARGIPAPQYGNFLLTEKIQTDGGGVWFLTFKTTFKAGTNTKKNPSRTSDTRGSSPLAAGKLRITIRPTTLKANDIYWTYINVIYS